jgi:hypothetical protein
MRGCLWRTAVGALVVTLACALSPGIAERGAQPGRDGTQQGFTPRWSVGDWWEVGYARVPTTTRGDIVLFNQSIDKPTSMKRFVVLGMTEFGGRRSYMIGSGTCHSGKVWSPTDTLYFEEGSGLFLGSDYGDVGWVLPGPYVDEGDGFPRGPSVPEFPLVADGTTFVASKSVQCHRGFGGKGWKYKGVPDGCYGPGYAVQVARDIYELDPIAVLDSGVQFFDVPGPPYIEVRIVSGGDGRRLDRQLWHRDLPWPLFTEEGLFPDKPGWEPEPSPNPIVPPRPPTQNDIDRENLRGVDLWGRSWLLSFGRVPRSE